MKLVDQFDDFIKNTVNLNKTRIKTLEDRVITIRDFIIDSDYTPVIKEFATQGSWAHKTIIKPSNSNKEFDADLVVFVKPCNGWKAKDYIIELKKIFKANKTYKDITSSKSRCVVLDYSGDFHLDIVPIVCCLPEDGYKQEAYYVCNQKEDEFELTDGKGFADWWLNQDSILENNNLIKVTRLLKYLRDIKFFSVKSIILTTLLGNQVDKLDGSIYANKFTDIPTTLKTIITRLDDWLQSNPELPIIENPVLPGESFTRDWDQDKYKNFRSKINQYREWIEDAFDEVDREESIKKWQRVFGNNFAKQETSSKSNEIIKQMSQKLCPGFDLVTAVKRLGKIPVLSAMPENLPHVQRPPYSKGPESKVLTIRATEKTSRDGGDIRILESGELINPHCSIKFEALINGKPANSSLFKVVWQIVNTDDQASQAGQLRGDFYPSDTENIRYESTEYRGMHWARAFLIHRRTRLIHGSSGRFFIGVD